MCSRCEFSRHGNHPRNHKKVTSVPTSDFGDFRLIPNKEQKEEKTDRALLASIFGTSAAQSPKKHIHGVPSI